MILRTLALGLFVVACSQATPSTPTTTSSTTPSPAPMPVNDVPMAAGPGMGETCGPGDGCGRGLDCVRYLGIAGARGPELKTCELRCNDHQPCPDGQHCTTIADGPGQVCRERH
ncbi:MAG: hypothetical protein M3680_03760 [Myxococcota bacterium]|nr:hypothetical protein [Myxococcota bacterium]